MIFPCAGHPAGGGVIVIVANPRVPAASISMRALANIYLLRVTTWPNGEPIVPVNKMANSRIRRRFSMAVFGQPPIALAEYWNRVHFQGENPPLVLGSDRDVVDFVGKVPGAIGYVRASTPTKGVKVLGRLP